MNCEEVDRFVDSHLEDADVLQELGIGVRCRAFFIGGSVSDRYQPATCRLLLAGATVNPSWGPE